MSSKKVYLVGAGPGDPNLITLKGLNILKQADVVIYDYLVDKRILDEAKEDAELICCDKLGKNRYSDGFLIHDEKISNLVIKKVKEGKKVIRLKSGDPGIFSRTSQELESLVKNKIAFEIVPGVTAANAAGCLSGIPLTDRRFASSCVFVTGHEDPTKKQSSLDWKSLSKCGTIVLYMAVKNLGNIAKQMLKAGKNKDTPVVIIQDVSLVTQKLVVGTLSDIAVKARRQRIRPPSIVIIGEVADLEKEFNWLKKSRRVLFTGLSKERYFNKETYFHLPLIKIEPLRDYSEFDEYLRNINGFDWIVFLSRYGVEYFLKRLIKVGLDTRKLCDINIAAIGNSTKNRLQDFGICADLVPKDESSQGLVNEFKKWHIEGKKMFLPRSDISDKGLKIALEKLGAEVTASFAYKNVMPKDLPDLDFSAKGRSTSGGRFFDEIMFTSPSTVRNFVKRYGKIIKRIKVNCIGEVTLKEAKKWQLLD